jgi:hypothetical protein
MTTIRIDKAVVEKIWRELDSIKALGGVVPRHAYVVAGQEGTDFAKTMKISDVADLCISLG